jgi:hypothetical protein
MKTFFSLVVVILSCTTKPLFSQITAGSVPPGTSIVHNIVTLSLSEVGRDTITYFDIDGDASQDIKVLFMKENPEVDGSNSVSFFTINNAFSLCINSGQPGKAAWYEFGDTLCTTNHEWGVDSLYSVGCFGGWFCPLDTSSANNKYLAYRKNATGEVGWIKISMSLYAFNDSRTITFNIDELLVPYLASGIPNEKNQIKFDMVPNPTADGIIEIRCPKKISSIELFNPAGQLIQSYLTNDTAIKLPEDKGLYIVRIKDEKGWMGIQKIVRM